VIGWARRLDDLSAKKGGREHFSMRWASVHTIEQTPRHIGHLDVLREHLDQKSGYLPER
jgi:hypothetical protein